MEVKVFTNEEKAAHIAEFEASGMSTAEFAKKIGVSPRTVRYWYHKFGTKKPEAASSAGIIDITGKVKPETVSFEMDGHRFTVEGRNLKALMEALK